MGGDGADVIEDANLSGGGDNSLDIGGARWWIHCRFPRVRRELWEDLPDNLLLLFNFHCYPFLVSLERRNGECG